ncbi:hypothetical protein FKP32DRAFT_391381 [Trametes sanguinea]|nr:hypothetical protein FKP32DRAFT_391381 [Trametes sanguinea]
MNPSCPARRNVGLTIPVSTHPHSYAQPTYNQCSSSHAIFQTVRALLPLEDRPGVISLLAGKPNSETFPITSMQFNLRDPVTGVEKPIALSQQELAKGLQYSASAGIPDLLDWLVGLQEYSHGRKRGEGWGLCFGTGSSDLIYKVGGYGAVSTRGAADRRTCGDMHVSGRGRERDELTAVCL